MWFGIPVLTGERMGDRGEKRETGESVPFARTCVLPFRFTMQKKAINYTWTKIAKEQYYSLQKQAVYYWVYASYSFPLYKHIRHSPNWWFCWKLLWSGGQKEVYTLNLQSVLFYILWAQLFLSKKNFLNLDFEIFNNLDRLTVVLSSVSSLLFLPIE